MTRLAAVSKRRVLVPTALYLASWCTTFFIGFFFYGNGSVFLGALFSAALMTILTVHEVGHYAQMRRCGVESTLPYFIPVPLPPFGTFGALIRMKSATPSRRALFDVAISGPLAGLAASLVFLTIGLFLSTPVAPSAVAPVAAPRIVFGEPLVFKALAKLALGAETERDLILHPVAIAGWIGVFLTTINLFPFGQLDGGHVLHALAPRLGARIAVALYVVAWILTIAFRLWNWAFFLALVAILKLRHPPTRDDATPLGAGRVALGLATLGFIAFGFTARPVQVEEPAPIVEESTDSSPSSCEPRL